MKTESEGGCGVLGIASETQVAGRHLLPGLKQMRNRCNGKGGGIAAAGIDPAAFGVTQEILDRDYLLAIAYLDNQAQAELEENFIHPLFEVDHLHKMAHLQKMDALEVTPPEVIIYFVRVKKGVCGPLQDEDEIVYQNSSRLNRHFYSADGEKRAFVLSHGKNLLVLKMVGFGDDVIRYYQLEDLSAHVWIGHHRYPTKGRVWHPGGAHPFIGMNEALVHNGDFANYFSICEYLAQRNIHPLFLTDTEVAALLFDLFIRTYKYPLEYVIEAFAPTTERDFTLLPTEKRHIYKCLQQTHLHASPDGPWFFLIAQSLREKDEALYRLIGITDTSMLRPQVFALQKGEVSIGFAASEKQAIDATLLSLSKEDARFWRSADLYWNARGGSYTDGGAFQFTVTKGTDGKMELTCSNKFSEVFNIPSSESSSEAMDFLKDLENITTDEKRAEAFEKINSLLDRCQILHGIRRSQLRSLLEQSIEKIAETLHRHPSEKYLFFSQTVASIPPCKDESQTLVIDAKGFPAEGEGSLARMVVSGRMQGFKKMLIFGCEGQRFIGSGFGSLSQGLHIDLYGSSGDYLASGLDGATLHVHGDAQDQLAQIMKSGTLVIYGSVGQTFMYGAKGGSAFIRGNAAGRPLINAVGRPRVVINGTCLDYLAESFMAGNPLEGGGFVIINGLQMDEQGNLLELPTPYPGNNLFSLASGGAIYIRDPEQKIQPDQLNGGIFGEMGSADWEVILPYLEENNIYFNIPVPRLLEYKGRALRYDQVYRKICPAPTHILYGEELWVRGGQK